MFSWWLPKEQSKQAVKVTTWPNATMDVEHTGAKFDQNFQLTTTRQEKADPKKKDSQQESPYTIIAF